MGLEEERPTEKRETLATHREVKRAEKGGAIGWS